MSILVMELRAGDTMLVNGAVIEFSSKTRVRLRERCRFLCGKQVLTEAEATTDLRRLYWRWQGLYTGERVPTPSDFDVALRQLPAVDRTSPVGQALAEARDAVMAGEFYQGLRRLRALITQTEGTR